MNLWDLLTGVPIRYASADLPRDVTGAGYDSHTIRPGQVFVAIHGANADGHDYTAQAGSGARHAPCPPTRWRGCPMSLFRTPAGPWPLWREISSATRTGSCP